MGKNKLTRRQFVATLTVGTGTVFLGKVTFGAHPFKSGFYSDSLNVVRLGNSGLKTTLLGMGTGFSGYNRSSNITRAGVAESIIRQAYEKGIRFFDCADSYGTHPYTASLLRVSPGKVILLARRYGSAREEFLNLNAPMLTLWLTVSGKN